VVLPQLLMAQMATIGASAETSRNLFRGHGEKQEGEGAVPLASLAHYLSITDTPTWHERRILGLWGSTPPDALAGILPHGF